jgi:hypothetical protein
MAEIMHRHHIVPLHMGGPKDGPTVLLTIEKHAEAHRELWELHGKWQDFVAWQCLSGAMLHHDAIKIAISEGGKITARRLTGVKRSQEARQRMSESAKRKSLEWLRDQRKRAKKLGLERLNGIEEKEKTVKRLGRRDPQRVESVPV